MIYTNNCGRCSLPFSDAFIRCPTCRDTFCSDCFAKLHNKGKFMTHIPMSLENTVTNPTTSIKCIIIELPGKRYLNNSLDHSDYFSRSAKVTARNQNFPRRIDPAAAYSAQMELDTVLKQLRMVQLSNARLQDEIENDRVRVIAFINSKYDLLVQEAKKLADAQVNRLEAKKSELSQLVSSTSKTDPNIDSTRHVTDRSCQNDEFLWSLSSLPLEAINSITNSLTIREQKWHKLLQSHSRQTAPMPWQKASLHKKKITGKQNSIHGINLRDRTTLRW